jgi:ferredoxin
LKAADGWQLKPWSNCTKGYSVAHIVAEPCFGCKYTDCVVVCPVECFYEGEQMVYIAPEECIDCEACVPECPVAAIFHEDNLPEQWVDYKELNAELAKACPVITEKKEPLVPPPG